MRATLIFPEVQILHVHSRVCVQWLGRGGGAQIMQSVVLCAANGQDGANAVAQSANPLWVQLHFAQPPRVLAEGGAQCGAEGVGVCGRRATCAEQARLALGLDQ